MRRPVEIKCRRKDKAGGDRRSPRSSASSGSPPPLFLLPPPDWVRSAWLFFFFPYFLVLFQLCCYNKKWILFCVLITFETIREKELFFFYWVIWFFKGEKFIWSCFRAFQVKIATVAFLKKKKDSYCINSKKNLEKFSFSRDNEI